jgi:putative polyketide hydroxylase
MQRAGKDLSTVDLGAGQWVLLAGPRGRAWLDLMNQSAPARALRVVYHGVEPAGDLEDVDDRWPAAYGVGADGAVLIRPDGFVAWRRHHADGAAQAALDAALNHILSEDDEPGNEALASRSTAVRSEPDHAVRTR